MKICISSTGPNLDSPVDPRFGRCQHFLIIDEEGKLIKSMPNEGVRAMRGAGITAAQLVANEKVQVIITGNIGPNAFGALKTSGIKIYTGIFGMTAKQALDKYNSGELKETNVATGPGQFDRGPGSGRGRGRSW